MKKRTIIVLILFVFLTTITSQLDLTFQNLI